MARLPRTERSEGRGVFALVMRCRDMMLFVYCRVGKNRDTWREPPAVPGRLVPPATYRSSLARKFSRCGKPMTYTDLLAPVNYFLNTLVFVSFLEL